MTIGRTMALNPSSPLFTHDKTSFGNNRIPLLLKGARAHGFPNELWTLKRIAAVIHGHFGVRYHPAPVWKI